VWLRGVVCERAGGVDRLAASCRERTGRATPPQKERVGLRERAEITCFDLTPSTPGHGIQGKTPWCVVCEQERVDDIELAVAQAKLASPWTLEEGTSWRGDDAVGAFNILSVLGHIVSGPIRVMRARRAAERAFPLKSLDEIASWRASNLRPET
jgi:hypothetical protein